MSEIATVFRHCPSCGRRFEIRLIGKKMVDERRVAEGRQFYHSDVLYYSELAENVPLTVDVKEFQYAYRCKHCGHQWVEIR